MVVLGVSALLLWHLLHLLAGFYGPEAEMGRTAAIAARYGAGILGPLAEKAFLAPVKVRVETDGTRKQGREVGGAKHPSCFPAGQVAVCALCRQLTALGFLVIALNLSLGAPVFFSVRIYDHRSRLPRNRRHHRLPSSCSSHRLDLLAIGTSGSGPTLQRRVRHLRPHGLPTPRRSWGTRTRRILRR